MHPLYIIVRRLIATASLLLLGATAPAAEIPTVDSRAPDFTLSTLDGKTVQLSHLAAQGRVVLVVLRGFPGYQCPVCDRQVTEFIAAAPAFAAAKTRVIFVYPGAADGLKAKAEEFRTMKGRTWPEAFLYALDPDFQMVNAYGLRWDAPKETAYPSTFVITTDNIIRFAKVSRTHGGRSTAAEILAQLP